MLSEVKDKFHTIEEYEEALKEANRKIKYIITNILVSYLESVIPEKKKIDKKFGTDGCRYPMGWNACIATTRHNAGLEQK